MSQKSLHDFFKVKGPSPRIQKSKSPKSPVIRVRKLTTMLAQKSPESPKRRNSPNIKLPRFSLDIRPTQAHNNTNLENVAVLNINSAIDKNNPSEISLNEIYDSPAEFKIESLNNFINYNGCINSLRDISAETLFKAIFVDVFLNPINCEFFNQNELRLIMSILMLSTKSKVIITRLLKRTKPWYRARDINESSKQSNTLDDFPLDEIILHSNENGVFKMIDCDDDIVSVLQLLNLRELQDVCKRLKRPHVLVKEKLIDQLLGIAKMNRSFFPGATSPRQQLLSIVSQLCGPAIQLSDMTLNIVKRILTLLYPVRTRFEELKDVFWMITEVDMGKRIYPDSVIAYYPVFRNRQHVIDYTEAKSALVDITVAMKLKNWETVKRLSTMAYNKLMSAGNTDKSFAINPRDSNLPSHVRRFTASFIWSKVLMLSIDSPKKDPNYANFVGQFLKDLINYDGVICASAGRCYSELSAVEMKYNKNFDESARLIEKALSEKHLSIVIEAELIERAGKLASKTTGISENWKSLMATLNITRKKKFECTPIENYIEAKKMQAESGTIAKSIWLIDAEENMNSYAQVEILAQSHYMKNGFTKGLHCEGNLPVTLCTCAFWNEIYSVSVPGAFICRYQHAPLDLWSSMFIENRQKQIQKRIVALNHLDIEDFCEEMYECYVSHKEHSSLMTPNLFHDDKDIKEIIRCLGMKKVIGLCLVLLNDFYHLSAGFPDLIVWNADTLECKVVEVKGPGDSLSIKQKLWINRLMELGINTEVCYVKAK
ncbi:hypothetical protein PV325_005727 [Microctonus aethiopoides]|uniref:Fanconi-associated nuclease n=1 Tax=Microctonus aethiopoides TaxID=144406 RepID=A0AA39KLV0_9HYME|nr:hypothetical protein PV325_005727 [Microctonus aethiopoides]KAK0166209.1 hypothetical protein PV328_004650 [Microctonus aethiopoides]